MYDSAEIVDYFLSCFFFIDIEIKNATSANIVVIIKGG